MILNPRWKLSTFGEKTWSDTDPESYAQGCRRRFELDYISTATTNSSSSHGIKRPAPDEDDEFLALLAERAAQCSGASRSVSVIDEWTSSPVSPATP